MSASVLRVYCLLLAGSGNMNAAGSFGSVKGASVRSNKTTVGWAKKAIGAGKEDVAQPKVRHTASKHYSMLMCCYLSQLGFSNESSDDAEQGAPYQHYLSAYEDVF